MRVCVPFPGPTCAFRRARHCFRSQVLAQVLRQQGGSGGFLAPSSSDARFVTRLGVQLVHAAEGHVAQELEEAGEDEALRETLETKLRALHNLPWKFVVIDNGSVNAFVTEM